MKLTTDQKMWFGMATAFVIFIAISALSVLALRRNEINNRWVDHTYQAIGWLQALETSIAELESGQRAYLLTLQPRYLQSYEGSKNQMALGLEQLKRLMQDNSSQLAHLNQLQAIIDERIAGAEKTIQIRRQYGLGKAAQVISEGRGHALCLAIRHQINGIRESENELLRRRNQRQSRSAKWAHASISVGAVFATLILAMGGFVLRRDLKARRRAELALIESEERFRLMVESVKDYAIYMLDPEGRVKSWNAGAERNKGYNSQEIIGRLSEIFYSEEDRQRGLPKSLLRQAVQEGRVEHEGWRVRKDGTRFWADVVITAMRDAKGNLKGFTKVTRDITRRREYERHIQKLNEQLRLQRDNLLIANKELEAFSYSVSHDLRAPLRGIEGFSKVLIEEYKEKFDSVGQSYLERIRLGVNRMHHIIDDLLNLSRITRSEMVVRDLDLADVGRDVVDELAKSNPQRQVEWNIENSMPAKGDPGLLRILMYNLVGNAWKFTSKRADAKINIGTFMKDRKLVYYIRDNGAGFDMMYNSLLFGAFQRLHSPAEFPGTGIGLATVYRIIQRHGGAIWAESKVNEGAVFYFTLS